MSEAGLSLETAIRRMALVVLRPAEVEAAVMRAVTAERLERRVAVRVGEGGMIVVGSDITVGGEIGRYE